MSKFIHKRHNVSVLLYHIVCPAKYRRAVFSAEVDKKLKEICSEIEKRYDIEFLEIGTDEDHVHFLVQSGQTMSPKKIVQTVKSITRLEKFSKVAQRSRNTYGAANFGRLDISSAQSEHTAQKK